MESFDFVKMESNAKKIIVYLNDKGITSSIKSSRYQKGIKAVQLSSNIDLKDLFSSVNLVGEFSDLSLTEEKSISGKYKTKLFTVSKGIGSLNKDDIIFVLNTYTEKGSIKTKDLAPDKLKLSNTKYTTLMKFDSDVIEGIKGLKVPDEIKLALVELYNNVSSNDTNYNSGVKRILSLLKPQDKQAIGKDFGEVLSLRWYLSQPFGKKFSKFYFSEISNEPLVDYVVEFNTNEGVVKKQISAKFETGAAPSILAIVGKIDSVFKNPTGEKKIACDTIKALSGLGKTKETTSVKILNVFRTLNLEAYSELKKVIQKENFTVMDINAHIQNIVKSNPKKEDRIKIFLSFYKKFYDKLGTNADQTSLSVVFSASTFPKYFSLIISPMGYALVKYLNSQEIYQNILNTVSKEIEVEQVYLSFGATEFLFKKKLFSKSNFKFAYGANAKNSDNTGIKFSMV